MKLNKLMLATVIAFTAASVAQAASNQGSGMLHRSQETISAHKRSAMRKLNVNKNRELHRVLLSQLRLG
ncbi:LuxR C-terminal-related transcriptional regulator [Serratia oryzae]|uniref:HTH luxR-type domain-containing protein n=1 Tax=Serratia oryzae TaxID=2034155 RepID=A0A1S8CG49_9GAMM|nr:LuxR C-terminal-related transcriptional regulator [Serratia oryzae]OMQ21031.1 hypothetical protein BMI79_15770 [Serratia oryzae]VXD04824.1 conserved exported hypothetical protein [Enterobacterales bacterium 8AC]